MSETELVERLERLERAHRRLKGFALAALVLVTALATIYATQPVPQKITAHEFDVVDSSGSVGIRMGEANVEIRDAKSGLPRVLIGSLSASDSVGIWLFDGRGSQTVTLTDLQRSESNICLFDTLGTPRATIALAQSQPVIKLIDPQGFGMDLGSTQTVTPTTGRTQQNSAASIVMFGKDKKLIWQAP